MDENDWLFHSTDLRSTNATVRDESIRAIAEVYLDVTTLTSHADEDETDRVAELAENHAQTEAVLVSVSKSVTNGAKAAFPASATTMNSTIAAVACVVSLFVAARERRKADAALLERWRRLGEETLVPSLCALLSSRSEGGLTTTTSPVTKSPKKDTSSPSRLSRTDVSMCATAARALAIVADALGGESASPRAPSEAEISAAASYTKNSLNWLRMGGSEDSLRLALGLIERLSLENPVVAGRLMDGLAVAPVLVEALRTPQLELESLRALMNATNHCEEGVTAFVRAGGVLVALTSLEIYARGVFGYGATNLNVPKEAPKSEEDGAREFECTLLLLGLLGNIAEDKNKSNVGPKAVIDAVVPVCREPACVFLANLFVASLPPRALADLQVSDTGSTIEFAWSPEELMLSSHVCLVLGCLVHDPFARNQAAGFIPGKRGFTPLAQVLEAFLAFNQQCGTLTDQIYAAVKHVVDGLQTAHGTLMLPPPMKSSKSP